MKKLVTLLFSLVMLISVSIPVLAAEETFVNLNEESVTVYLYEGNSQILDYETNSEEVPVWENSSQDVIMVENGVITPIAEGTAAITITVGEVFDTCEVTVIKPELKVETDEAAVYVGNEMPLAVSCDIVDEEIVFTSADESIATVDTDGVINGVSEGTVEIWVEASGCERLTITVHVVDAELEKPVISSKRDAAGISVQWNKVEGASKYELYRKVVPGKWTLIKTTTGRTYLDKSLTWSSRHYYKVKAYGTSYGLETESAFSSTTSKTVNTLYVPKTFSVKRGGYTSIRVSWSRSYPATGYEIYRSTSQNGTYKKVKTITSGSTLSYKDTGLTTGKRYYYKVRATYDTNKSSFTSVKSAVPSLAAPVMKKTVYSTKNSIKIQWNKVSGANGYNVYRRASSSDSWKYIGRVTSGSTLTYTDKTASGRYYYSVRAYRNVNGNKVSGLRSEAVRCRTFKTTTVKVTCDEENVKNTLKWNSITGAKGYVVYRKLGSSGTWKKVATLGNVTKYTAKVPHGYYVYWRIRPIYEYNGVTTYGPYSAGDEQWIVYYDPEYSVYMSSETDSSTSVIVMAVTNYGVGNLRIYSKNAYYSQPDYESYNRDVYMIDIAALENNTLKKISYTDIAPGEMEYICFVVNGNSTWYDEYGVLWYEFRYDGMYYEGYSSSYYGSRYEMVE